MEWLYDKKKRHEHIDGIRESTQAQVYTGSTEGTNTNGCQILLREISELKTELEDTRAEIKRYRRKQHVDYELLLKHRVALACYTRNDDEGTWPWSGNAEDGYRWDADCDPWLDAESALKDGE